MHKIHLFLIIFTSLFLTSGYDAPIDDPVDHACLQTNSGIKVSPFDVFLPSGLPLKPSTVHQSHQQDSDFHIGLQDSNMALLWMAQDKDPHENYLCGAVLSLDQKPDKNESLYERLTSILSSKFKMICEWIASPQMGNTNLLSPARSSDIQWEKIVESNEKWSVCGVQTMQDVPVKYYIRKQNQKVWVTKEEAFNLALQGQLEIVIPPESD